MSASPDPERGWGQCTHTPDPCTTLALALALGIPTAYVIARYRFRGNADFGFWVLSTRMTPPVAMLIPFFVLYVRTGLIGTYVGLVIAHVALNLSIVTWLMKGFFEDLPDAGPFSSTSGP